jgi:hypothetical protein
MLDFCILSSVRVFVNARWLGRLCNHVYSDIYLVQVLIEAGVLADKGTTYVQGFGNMLVMS